VRISSRVVYNSVKSVVSWVPIVIFLGIVSYLLLTEFRNDVDEYFVRIILKACLILITSCALSQFVTLILMVLWRFLGAMTNHLLFLKEFFDFICAFPIIDIGIFSIGIFFSTPQFYDWVVILTGLMILETLRYWIDFSKSPLRSLYAFAHFHKIDFYRTHKVLGPYLVSTCINYFFICLKKFLLPLVFIMVVMDFRIILPRLVQAGLTYHSFVLLMSLMISLHLLTYRRDTP
jgi:hypothetical protein